MPEGKFKGTSQSGNIHEAIEIAVQNAKDGLPSSLVHWELIKISGEYGGYTEITELTVEISAKTPD